MHSGEKDKGKVVHPKKKSYFVVTATFLHAPPSKLMSDPGHKSFKISLPDLRDIR